MTPNSLTAILRKNCKLLIIFFIVSVCILTPSANFAQNPRPKAQRTQSITLYGKVVSENKEALEYVTIQLKDTHYGTYTDAKGEFTLQIPSGKYTLTASSIGFKSYETTFVAGHHPLRYHITLHPADVELSEITVTSTGVSRVKESAFNAVAVDTKEMLNSNKNLGEALNQLPGMKLRESGGVGSDMQLMLDGFSGKHVKVFIDGVPQEGAGTGFDLNNIPVNFAKRIEVYKGVVPVGFGSDAIGGIINIVTDKQRNNFHMDASYSYGSFNTHKSYVNVGQRLRHGFTYEINAFQNYSDNDYYIDNWVRTFTVNPDGSVTKHPVDENDVKHVRRFNDMFHNEAVIGKLGVTGKTWADRLMFGLSYSHFYKEIQTGVYQDIVFGQKHRHGHSIVPSMEYVKHNLLAKGLDLTVNANYNHNITNNIDTTARYYNWLGEYYIKSSQGEQAFQNNVMKNTNWNATANLNYRIGHAHTFTLNHVFSSFHRTSRSYIGISSLLTAFDIPKITRKNITGLSYRLMPSDVWNISVFGKHYRQFNQGPVSESADGVGNYINMKKNVEAWGYGAAGSYFLTRNLQAKLSYEKAYRLPTTDELFGDEDLEAGKANLKPESSNNLNANLSFSPRWKNHGMYVEAGLIYRDTKDYIKRGIGKHGDTQFGIYENHGHVKTKGYSISVRYTFSKWLNVGGTFNNIDTRDYEPYFTGGSEQKNVHYKDRLPNIPYRYANMDANVYWHDFLADGNTLTVTYDNFWQHEFPLYWESIGSKDSKNYVPTQFSHNISLAYSLKKGKYNISLECKNITDAKLYDNFSLQRAGRAFYAKFRIHFEK